MPVDPNRERVAIRYQADDGLYYSIVTTRNHAAAVGATGALPADPPLPTKWKPRLVHGLQLSAGRDRKIGLVMPSKTPGLWTGTVATFNVDPYGAFDVTGRTGERRTQGAPGFDGNANPPNERVSIKYRADNGADYSIVTTRAHAAAVSAVDGSGFPSYPDVWTPRHYNLLSENLTGADQKARLVEPDPAAASWVSDAAYQFNINGLGIFDSTGRKDENRPRTAPSYVP